MSSETQTPPASKALLWGGWIMGVLPALMLLFSGVMKLVQPEGMEKGFNDLGWDLSTALLLGIVEIACVVIYLAPRTAVLGAILLTGYMGGAIATHVRIGEAFYMQLFVGMLFWGGLWLRDARVRALLPLRS